MPIADVTWCSCAQLTNGAGGNPDLHYNRAAVLKYLEEYSQALEGYRRALEIDPTLPAIVRGPCQWSFPDLRWPVWGGSGGSGLAGVFVSRTRRSHWAHTLLASQTSLHERYDDDDDDGDQQLSLFLFSPLPLPLSLSWLYLS